ncbi:hypothetical protein [Streptomyces sp. NPDC058874]
MSGPLVFRDAAYRQISGFSFVGRPALNAVSRGGIRTWSWR